MMPLNTLQPYYIKRKNVIADTSLSDRNSIIKPLLKTLIISSSGKKLLRIKKAFMLAFIRFDITQDRAAIDISLYQRVAVV